MFGRLQTAGVAGGNQQAAAGNGGGGQGGGGRNGGSASRNSRNIAGSALKKAGLMDDDVGMRSASSSGPSRRGGRAGRAGQAGAAAGPSRIQVDDEQGGGAKNGKARKARDRANPLAARLNRNKPATLTAGDPTVKGQAFSIRGASNNAAAAGGPGKGKAKSGGRAQAAQHVIASSDPVFNTQGTIGVLRRFLASRWNGSANFLNLDAMKDDAILKEAQLAPPGQPGAHKDIGSVLWKLASELYPSMLTLSLANNDFKTLLPASTLPQYLPELQNLSLEGNDLKWTKDLMTFSKNKHGKLGNLRELMLTGTPMQQNAAAAMNEEGYRSEVLAHFPTLTLLDRVSVTAKETAIAQLPSSTSGKGSSSKASDQSTLLGPDTPTRNFPVQVRPGFSDEAANGIVPGFLHKFFTLYDTARESPELRAAYASNATWSMVLNQRVPPRAVKAGYIHSNELPRQRDLNWHGYKNVVDHNIMALGTRPPTKGFPVGPNAIIATLTKLPKTSHPLTEASKFVVDSWILPNGGAQANGGVRAVVGGATAEANEHPDAVLFINVHGEFAEAPSMGVRSFSRTFIVAPSNPNSTAAQNGWPCVILSEQLTIKHYFGIEAWKPDSLAVGGAETSAAAQQQSQPAAPNGGGQPGQQQQQQQPQQQQPADPNITPEQHSLSLQFSQETNLTYPFAVQCLQENGWQPETAMGVFQNLKQQGAIPAELFKS